MVEEINYTKKVRQELADIIPNARHCRLAELGGMLASIGKYSEKTGELSASSESILVIEKIEKLVKKILDIDITQNLFYDKNRVGKEIVTIVFTKSETDDILKSIKVTAVDKENDKKCPAVSPLLYTLACCKRAFIRGVFMACGSLTNPEKDYHLEFSTPDRELAEQLIGALAEFDIEAKKIIRKKQHVVYIKDGERIVDVLNVMEAHVTLMDMENIRIIKDVRNQINRRVNCEAANIQKTISAAIKQCEDIRFVQSITNFDGIDESVVRTAMLRLENPEATLSELVELHDEKVSKSGINHRLKKISEIAGKLREEVQGTMEERNGNE
ncbi:MAG: DNA-binding protein WhiA [Lachnospiraceae bacterium]|nr:DNA-binding protein WhiA [Lachnospiraceae bacterium]